MDRAMPPKKKIVTKICLTSANLSLMLDNYRIQKKIRSLIAEQTPHLVPIFDHTL